LGSKFGTDAVGLLDYVRRMGFEGERFNLPAISAFLGKFGLSPLRHSGRFYIERKA
jgi:hypothetical protein